MSILEKARQDAKRIVGDKNGWAVSFTITTPDGTTSRTLSSIHSKHHLGVDSEGNVVSSANAHVCFAESDLLNYPIRNGSGKVNLKSHRVVVADSTGTSRSYLVKDTFPDQMLGLIVLILEDYASAD